MAISSLVRYPSVSSVFNGGHGVPVLSNCQKFKSLTSYNCQRIRHRIMLVLLLRFIQTNEVKEIERDSRHFAEIVDKLTIHKQGTLSGELAGIL